MGRPVLKSRHLWPLLTAALVGVPVLYVASFGPACWILSLSGSESRDRRLPAIYTPLGAAMMRDGVIGNAIYSFASFGLQNEVEVPINELGAVMGIPPPADLDDE